MKSIFFICYIFPLLAVSQQKINRDYFENLLSKKQYDRVFLEGNDLLSQPYGKTSPLTYYYIGRSLCGRGYTKQGKQWYQYIKQKLPIDHLFEVELAKAEVDCSASTSGNMATTPTVVNITINTSYTPSQPGGIRGKGGFTLGCDKDANENYDNLKANDSLVQRVFPRNRKAAALEKLRKFLPADYNIDTSGRFLVVSLVDRAYYQKDVAAVAEQLEFAYQYFSSTYRLRTGDQLFTVYLVPDRYALRKLAKQVHDIRLSEANIGYSSLADLSLLGIAKPNSVGTLYHELFHLMIRSDLGDISPWLDEGMACLYSVYKIKNGQLEGAYNTWRVTHFKLLLELKPNDRVTVPSLQQLLSYNWQQYQGGVSKNLCVASVHYALSNLFTLFLQDKSLLALTVETFKHKRSFSADSLLPGPDDIRLLEELAKQPIDTIANQFYFWLQERYRINMNDILQRRPSSPADNLPSRFQGFYDSVTHLFQQLGAGNNDTKKLEVRNLKKQSDDLFNAVTQYQRNYQQRQNDYLQELAMRDMDDSVKANGDTEYERFATQKEEELHALLRRMVALLPRPTQFR